MNDQPTHTMPTDAPRIPTNEELAHEWLSKQDSPRRAKGHPQDSQGLVFQVANTLVHGFDLGASRGLALLTEYCGRSDKPWTAAELDHKIREAVKAPQKHKAGGLARWILREKGIRVFTRGEHAGKRVAFEPRFSAPNRLQFDLEKLRFEVRDVNPMVDEKWLAEVSPVDVSSCSTAGFLEAMYGPDERVLIFTDFYSQGQFIYWCGRGGFRLARRQGVPAVRSELPAGGPDGVWFLCQPVSGEWKLNPRSLDVRGNAKMSRRSEEVVTSWRYLVLESDDAPAELWIRLLAKLPLPIAAIYTSGGRSIHALVKIDAESKDYWDRYKALVVPILSLLGADAAAITAVRLTRLPGCMRGGRMQQLLYLDPRPDAAGVPILWRESSYRDVRPEAGQTNNEPTGDAIL